MNKKFDDLLEDDLACFLCALIAFALFFRYVDLSPGRRCLSAVAAMHVTPRTCPGPGDLWQLSWQEEKRQAEYERLLEDFFEKYIPRYCDERINQLAEEGEDERHPEIEPIFDAIAHLMN